MWLSGSSANLLALDAALHVDETLTAQVTEHPLESGAVVSDNVIMKPRALKIEGLISATPMPKVGVQTSDGRYTSEYEQEAFSNELVTIEAQPGSRPDPTRPQSALETLRAIHAARMPVSIGTGASEQNGQISTNVYDNMIVETLEIPREQNTGDALHFTATLKEIIIVSSQTAPLPKVTNGKSGSQALGKQATTAAPSNIIPDSLWKSGLRPTVGGVQETTPFGLPIGVTPK
jgi:hypothetical protein